MSTGSVSPPTELPAVDPLALERLIGVRSSKPSFYAAWRDKSARLDHTIETLERISSALCATPEGPGAVCDAVVDAAAHHFDARWAAMMLSREHVVRRSAVSPRTLARLAERALAAQRPVMLPDED